jgi:hypothetical protein
VLAQVSLTNLRPVWTGPDDLSFACPLHPERMVSVNVGPHGHRVTSLTRDFATLSIDPSLRGTHHGPGRPCGLHVIIKNGLVLPAQ